MVCFPKFAIRLKEISVCKYKKPVISKLIFEILYFISELLLIALMNFTCFNFNCILLSICFKDNIRFYCLIEFYFIGELSKKFYNIINHTEMSIGFVSARFDKIELFLAFNVQIFDFSITLC